MAPGLRVAQLLNVAFDMCAWVCCRYLLISIVCDTYGTSGGPWLSVKRLHSLHPRQIFQRVAGFDEDGRYRDSDTLDYGYVHGILLLVAPLNHTRLGPHDPIDYPNIKFVATAGEVCPQGTRSFISDFASI